MVNGQALQAHEPTLSSEGGTLQSPEGVHTRSSPSEGETIPVSTLSEPFDFSSEDSERSPAIQDCEGDGKVSKPRYTNLEHTGLRRSKRD